MKRYRVAIGLGLFFTTITTYGGFVYRTSFVDLDGSVKYRNPVTQFSCADPGVYNDLNTSGFFYLACTGGRFAVRKSTNLVDWTRTDKVIINTPTGLDSWAIEGKSWAPEITKIGSNFVAYYTQGYHHNSPGGHPSIFGAIGYSIAPDLVTNTFQNITTDPLASNDAEGGIIDPSYFVDSDGKNYLVYKSSGTSSRYHPSKILIRELNLQGTGFVDTPRIIKVGGYTNVTIVEGADLVKRGDYYYLFYSHGDYGSNYSVRVARSGSIYGPYVDDRTILRAKPGARFFAPGHGKVIVAGNRRYYFYHAYDRQADVVTRYGMLDKIFWFNGWPIVNDGFPSEEEQYVPMTGNTYYPRVDLKWDSHLPNAFYSLDVRTSEGNVIAPCLNAGVLGRSRSISFSGNCVSANVQIRIDSDTDIRICAAANNNWSSQGNVKCSRYAPVNRSRISVQIDDTPPSSP